MATEPPPREHGRQLARVNNFSDGLFTIAATLLVLSIDLPSGPASALESRLDNLIEPTLIYFLSFAVIGLFWLRHHQLFGASALPTSGSPCSTSCSSASWRSCRLRRSSSGATGDIRRRR